MIGLATLTVRPAWMPHERRIERVLKHHHKDQPPQLFPSELGRAGRTANLRLSEVHGLCLRSPFCASIYSIEIAGVPLAPFRCRCEIFEQNLISL